MATSSKADILGTEHFYATFHCISEMYVKFQVF